MFIQKIKWFVSIIFVLVLSNHSVLAAKTINIINFNNLTNKPLVQTQDPYLDNFTRYSSDEDYEFIEPKSTIPSLQSSKTTVSYDWYYNWYGVSQFAYNYPGRSNEYGCFVTEMRLSWHWAGSYHIVISSYRQDPQHPNDYLICHVKKDVADDTFTVDMISSQDEKEKNDYLLDDTKRYNTAGDTYELAHTSGSHYINKPIPLNPSLSLYPDQLEPEKPRTLSTIETNSPKHSDVITVINHARSPVVAGQVILDKFSQFNDQYDIKKPPIILSGKTETITIGTLYLPDGGFDLERFNYHIKGYDQQSGCFITSSKRWVSSTPVASFYFDSKHSKNLYCLVTDFNTVEIYDDPQLEQLTAHGCDYTDLKSCISTYHHFYQDGDTLEGMHFKYKTLPLSPNPKHYLKVSPGAMNPTLYYLPKR